MNTRTFQRGGIVVVLSTALLVYSGCPVPDETLHLEDDIVGTWTLHQGGTITFFANGTFETSEGTEGAYQILGRSVVLDLDSVEGELNQVLTYLGTLADGQLLFSQETPLGFTQVGP
ncbi:MAG: hypothetical protein IT364_12255 [Candidatus Hydrogenedentes bacterium]|nr:hypothetical protein [Candidatus Hydrogenedentota bacterium]